MHFLARSFNTNRKSFSPILKPGPNCRISPQILKLSNPIKEHFKQSFKILTCYFKNFWCYKSINLIMSNRCPRIFKSLKSGMHYFNASLTLVTEQLGSIGTCNSVAGFPISQNCFSFRTHFDKMNGIKKKVVHHDDFYCL